MSAVLVIDPSPFCRETLTNILASNGIDSLGCTPDAAAGLLQRVKPRLLLIELAGTMGTADGWTVLTRMRTDARWKDLPVIALTELSNRESVLHAAQLSVRDYILKHRFTVAELLTRVHKYVGPTTAEPIANDAGGGGLPAETVTSPASSLAATPAAPDSGRIVLQAAKDLGVSVLTREQMMRRIALAPVKTLPGVVAELIAIASSPRGTVADLIQTLRGDPVLASRLLRIANSAAYASQKPRITNVEEAVKNIGMSGVQNLVMSVGVFETFGPNSGGGNGEHAGLIQCWQHSLAVASLMEQLTPVGDAAPAGVPYVVGLCHDLVEIVLREYFHDAHLGVTRIAAKTSIPIRTVEAEVFGIAYDELAMMLMSRLGLPQVITAPIQELFERAKNPKQYGAGSVLGRCLRAANIYANGLMLAGSGDEPVLPLSKVECRYTFSGGPPPRVDDSAVRTAAMTTAAVLGGLSGSESMRACEPLIPKSPIRAAYVRHDDYADFDPLHALLRLTCDSVDVRGEWPTSSAQARYDGADAIIVAAPRRSNASEASEHLKLFASSGVRVLYLCGLDKSQVREVPPMIEVQRLPISINTIGTFLHGHAANGHPAAMQKGPGDRRTRAA